MSIAYILFKIPRTFEELDDKIKQRRETQVDVVFEVQDYGSDEELTICRCYVGLDTGKSRLKLSEYIHAGSGGTESRVKFEQLTFNEALQTAQRLRSLGLEVTINRELIDWFINYN